MKGLKQCPLFCCIVFLLANLHVSFSSEEQNFLFDGIHLQVKTMTNRPVFQPASRTNTKGFSVAVTSLIEVYNLQRHYIDAGNSHVILASIMQAIADDTCAWLKTKVDTVMGHSFNCTKEQLQEIKSWIEYKSKLITARYNLVLLFRRNRNIDFLHLVNTHFDCSNPDNVLLRNYLNDVVNVNLRCI